MRKICNSSSVLRIVAVVAIAMGGATSASAASVNSFTRIGSEIIDNDFGTPGIDPATSSVLRNIAGHPGSNLNIGLSAAMTRDVRFFRASANASGTMPLFGSNIQFAGVGGVSNVLDRLTIAGTPSAKGTLRLPWHVTGSVNAGYSIAPGTGPFKDPHAGSDLQFICNVSGGCIDPVQAFSWGPGSQSIDMIVNVDIPFTFNVPIDYQLTISLSSGFSVRPNGGEGIMSGHANADFSHTGLLGPAIVLDSDGNVVSGSTIISESGVDYLAALNPPSEVPEPESSLLILFGLAAVGLKYRLRSVSCGHAR